MRVISNISRLTDGKPADLDLRHNLYVLEGSLVKRVAKAFMQSFRFDYLVFNDLPRDAYALAFLQFLVPFNRCKLVVNDLKLPIPRTPLEQIVRLFRIVLLRKVHLFVNHQKDNKGNQCIYRIDSKKFRYIPFKVNQVETARQIETSDEGYIFAGGRTRRDFKTFIEAVKGLSYPVRLVAPENSVLAQHGSWLDADDLPPNVEIIRDDGTPEPFFRQIAGAKFVVIPIFKDTIFPSGLGVYLKCMALKKCVVISAGPAVNGILTPSKEAIIVPPENSEALREAIKKAYEDNDYRNRIAENGYEYAAELGGEARLYKSILEVLREDLESQRRA